MSEENRDYVDDRRNYADGTPLQITLREMHGFAVNPRFWIGFALVLVLLTATGPFGTLLSMNIAERLFYWLVTSATTFAAGLFCSIFVSVLLTEAGIAEWLARLMSGAVAGLPIGFIVWLINVAMGDAGGWADLLRLTGYCLVISTVISLIYYLVEVNTRHVAGNASPPAPIPAPSLSGASSSMGASLAASPVAARVRPGARFFERLPVTLGRDIISLQAQDHYVKVTTTRGSEMILMRLSDAEGELEGVAGIRTHRSWWVARAHCAGLERRDGKQVLVLSNGSEVPVSRTCLPDVRKVLAT